MRHGTPDRVPVMCQLALGHYFLRSGGDAIDIWHDGEAFASALVSLQRRYGFDGILVNLPGRDPEWRRQVDRVETVGRDRHVVWRDGRVTVCPPDDNPHVFVPDRRTRPLPRLEDLEPDRLFYLEPHGLLGLSWPCASFPPWQWDTIRRVRELAPDVSVHGEVFSPFSQLCEAVGVDEALMALKTDPGRVKACLERALRGDGRADGRPRRRRGRRRPRLERLRGRRAHLDPRSTASSSCPSRRASCPASRPAVPALPSTPTPAGRSAIGWSCSRRRARTASTRSTRRRSATWTWRRRSGGSADGSSSRATWTRSGRCCSARPDAVRADAARRIAIGAPGGGYVLSTACSVPPGAPPDNVQQLRAAAEAG